MSIEFTQSLESIFRRTAENYGVMLEKFRPFPIKGELNERNLTTQFLLEIKNSIPDAIICQEFHIPNCKPDGGAAFVDAVVITEDITLFIEAKRNDSIMSNFAAIDCDIEKLNSEALKKQFLKVWDDRERGLPKRAYGVILADSWKKSLTDKWIKKYSNEPGVELNKYFNKIKKFDDFSENYDLLFGVFEIYFDNNGL
jgi:hypothetical protein